MATKFMQQPETGFFHRRKAISSVWEGAVNIEKEPLEKSECPRFYINFNTQIVAAWDNKNKVPLGQPEQFIIVDDSIVIKKGVIDLSEMHMGKYPKPIARSNSFAMFLQQNAKGTISIFMVTEKPQDLSERFEADSAKAVAYSA